MQFNKHAYPWYYAATSFLAWLPVFFLYFSGLLSLKDVLILEAIYYISVVILEVPTGYFSDIFGRKKTLVLGAIFLCLACIFYFIGTNFWFLTVGQVLFALHMSFVSGTNTVFHFESLQAIGEGHTYGDREAIVQRYGMLAGGTSALIGGAVASLDLSYVYLVTFISAIIALIISLQFTEPKHEIQEQKAMENMFRQISATIEYLKMKPIGWIFLFFVGTFALTHVPYEFYQPYLDLLSEEGLLYGISVPVISGILYAGARYVGAFSATYSMKWSRSIGLTNYLMLNILFVNFIIVMLSLTLSNVIVLIVLFRSFSWAAIKAPINAIITPAIETGQRATFHSMMSLVCRLSFFGTLLFLSFFAEEGASADWDSLQKLLRICFIAGFVIIIPLWLTAKNNLSNPSGLNN